MQKLICVLLVICVLLLFFGCDELETNVSSLDNAGEQQNNVNVDTPQNSQNQVNDSTGGGAVEMSCENYPNLTDIETCWYDKAVEKLDYSLCEILDKESTLPYLRTLTCNIDIMLKKADYSKCEEFNEFDKQVCYQAIGEVNLDLAYCDKLIDVPRKDGCYTIVATETANVTLCESVSQGLERDLCYNNLSCKLEDKSVCGKIENDLVKNGCVNDFIEGHCTYGVTSEWRAMFS